MDFGVVGKTPGLGGGDETGANLPPMSRLLRSECLWCRGRDEGAGGGHLGDEGDVAQGVPVGRLDVPVAPPPAVTTLPWGGERMSDHWGQLCDTWGGGNWKRKNSDSDSLSDSLDFICYTK